jgi:hypothetical protein
MMLINATGLHRKFAGAQWRDLGLDALSWKPFSRERSMRPAAYRVCCGFSRGRAGDRSPFADLTLDGVARGVCFFSTAGPLHLIQL